MTTPKLILIFATLFAALLPNCARAEEPSRESIIKDLAESRDVKRAQALREALKIEPDAALIQAVTPLLKDSANEVRRGAAAFFEKYVGRPQPNGKDARNRV